jgi:hypothetical protein
LVSFSAESMRLSLSPHPQNSVIPPGGLASGSASIRVDTHRAIHLLLADSRQTRPEIFDSFPSEHVPRLDDHWMGLLLFWVFFPEEWKRTVPVCQLLA